MNAKGRIFMTISIHSGLKSSNGWPACRKIKNIPSSAWLSNAVLIPSLPSTGILKK
jgi:hypothetical protein